jgi:hypothetical protein
MDNEMCKWFAAVHSEANLVTGPIVIRKAKPFYDGNENKRPMYILCRLAAKFW